MSIFIHADSRWRDRNLYPNPSNYYIDLETVKSWKTSDRTVLSSKQHDKPQLVDPIHTVKLHHLTIPQINLTNASTFGMSFTPTFLDYYPYLYVSLQNATYYKDSRIMNTGEVGVLNTTSDVTGTVRKVSLKDAIFVAVFDKAQSGATTSWLHYKCGMVESYRFDGKDSMHVRVFTPDGLDLPIVDNDPPLPANNLVQVNALFEVMPFFRNSEYDNHYVNQKYSHSN